MKTNLIGARIGNVDNASCLFGLQVSDETTLQGLGLAKDVFLVATTWQSQQQAIVILHLQAHSQTLGEQALLLAIIQEIKSQRDQSCSTHSPTRKKQSQRTHCHPACHTIQLRSL